MWNLDKDVEGRPESTAWHPRTDTNFQLGGRGPDRALVKFVPTPEDSRSAYRRLRGLQRRRASYATQIPSVSPRLALSVWAPSASATDGENRQAAQVLFDEGTSLMQKGDYTAACQKFEEASRLYPSGPFRRWRAGKPR
jgi:hypothetical protein